jgi:hypothetical protein
MQRDPRKRPSARCVIPANDSFLEALRHRLVEVKTPESLRARIAAMLALELGRHQ